MQDHQLRVVEELEALDEKIEKLVEFMHKDIYPTLSAVDQGLVMVQLVAMENYSEALGRRIELF